MHCKRRRAKPRTQQMASLPEYRFSPPLHAFSKVGLDFAGPFYIKVGRAKKRLKAYILVFSCLQVRAVHFEVTESQDTNSVVNAISRFVDLRGMPTEILSDNWKAFITDDKELQSWVRQLDFDLITKPTEANVKWHFTPPYGPHHGGIYETMVKSAKRALATLGGKSDLTMDEFRTFISRCGALLNGRPLTRVRTEDSTEILTPNHFLYGNLGGAVEPSDVDDLRKRWHRVHSLVQQFWSQLFKEYIPLLHKRNKWFYKENNLEVGELVLEIKPDMPRGMWKLAVVEKVYPSADNFVRRVQIRTSEGLYDRPIVKLAPLEVRTQN
jgi:hypothetical protein